MLHLLPTFSGHKLKKCSQSDFLRESRDYLKKWHLFWGFFSPLNITTWQKVKCLLQKNQFVLQSGRNSKRTRWLAFYGYLTPKATHHIPPLTKPQPSYCTTEPLSNERIPPSLPQWEFRGAVFIGRPSSLLMKAVKTVNYMAMQQRWRQTKNRLRLVIVTSALKPTEGNAGITELLWAAGTFEYL